MDDEFTTGGEDLKVKMTFIVVAEGLYLVLMIGVKLGRTQCEYLKSCFVC
jgi:hypothetical protein